MLLASWAGWGPAHAAALIPLRAGPLTLQFDAENAFLRYIHAGTNEILRGIYAAVRDQNWGTVRPEVSNLEVDNQGDHFSVKFDVRCRERNIDFAWHGTIRGDVRGELEFAFDGVARSSFQRNRIGFCVLHAPAAAGKPWKIENVRGETTPGQFPTFISPHQPAKEIREIAHEITPGWWAHVRMEGDTFEMEDQRNWTDASFKTYCTPLELPYPAPISEGTKVVQKIKVRLEGPAPKSDNVASPANRRILLSLEPETTALPRIGLQVSSQTEELSDTERQRLKALHLDHLRVDLSFTNDSFPRQFRQATAQARVLGVKLHVALHLGPQPDQALNRLAVETASLRPPVSVWLVVGADPAVYQRAQASLRRLVANARVGAAHDDVNFTQLNRIRPASGRQEVIAYGVIPEIHAFDNLSIMETLPIQVDTVRSARQFIGDSPLIITPITLRLQTLAQAPLPGELPSNVDPRQPTLFAAAWTLGSFKYLAEAGVQSVTYYETVGWKGIMEAAGGAPLPGKFPSTPGAVFPIYHVLRDISDFAGERVQRVSSSDTLSVAALALRKGGRVRLLVANLTDQTQIAAMRGLGETVEVRQLDAARGDAGSARAEVFRPAPDGAAAMELPLVLPPYGIARLEHQARESQR